MTEQKQCEEQLIKAFAMMWGKFPEAVMLIHRDRTILAANETCNAVPGTKCNAVNPEKHKGCKANQALDNNAAATSDFNLGEHSISSYWVPVAGVSDYFIHFSIGYTEAMKAMQPQTLFK